MEGSIEVPIEGRETKVYKAGEAIQIPLAENRQPRMSTL
jgi:hypothetical protein